MYSKTKTFGSIVDLLLIAETYITNKYITSKGCDIWGIDRSQQTDRLNKRLRLPANAMMS